MLYRDQDQAQAQAQVKDEDQDQDNNKSPLVLYYNLNEIIAFNHLALKAIQQNFNADKKICIIVAAGILGTGKSTWLNAILYHYNDGSEFSSFKVGHSIQTQTEGLWVYPYPLYSKANPDIQIMLLDMEGMGGIKEGDFKVTKKALQRLYTIGFCIASVFTLHCQNRLDSGTVEQLIEAHYVMKILKDELKIRTPMVNLFIKDADEDAITGKDGKDFFPILDKAFNLDDDLKKNFIIRPRYKLPSNFLKSKASDYSLLEESKYLGGIKKFIEESSTIEKLIPGTNKPIKLENLLLLIEDISKTINSENFKSCFLGSLDAIILNLIQPIKDQKLKEYSIKCNDLSVNYDVNKEIDDFQNEIKALQDKFSHEFLEACKKAIKKTSEESFVLRNQIQQFNVQLKDTLYIERFTCRKMAEIKNKKLLDELNEQQITHQEQKKKIDMALTTLRERLAEEKERTNQEIETAMKEYNTKLENIKKSHGGLFTKIGKAIDKLFTF